MVFFSLLGPWFTPLRIIFMFRVWLIFYSTNFYLFQEFPFLVIRNETIINDQFRVLLRLITWILTFGCFLAIMLSFRENHVLYFLIVFISACRVMVFRAFCAFEFYLNFEITLFPIFVIILGWGYQPERFNTRIALLLYTISGSLPLLVYISIFNAQQGLLFWQISESNFSSLIDICFY